MTKQRILFILPLLLLLHHLTNGQFSNRETATYSSEKLSTVGDEKWAKHFQLPGLNGIIYSLDNDGTNVFAGGVSMSIPGLNIPTNVAMWDGDKWSMLGTSVGATSDVVFSIKKLINFFFQKLLKKTILRKF